MQTRALSSLRDLCVSLFSSFNSCTLSGLGLALSYTIHRLATQPPFSSLLLPSFPLAWAPPFVSFASEYDQASKILSFCRSNERVQHLALKACWFVWVFARNVRIHLFCFIPLFSPLHLFPQHDPPPHFARPLIPILSTSFLSLMIPRHFVSLPFFTSLLCSSLLIPSPPLSLLTSLQREGAENLSNI